MTMPDPQELREEADQVQSDAAEKADNLNEAADAREREDDAREEAEEREADADRS